MEKHADNENNKQKKTENSSNNVASTTYIPSNRTLVAANHILSNNHHHENNHHEFLSSENTTIATITDNHNMHNDTSLLPHLESLERMMQLPVLGAAWQQSQDVYVKVKGHNRMFKWALSTAEDAVHRAISTAAPIVSKFDRPIHYVDQTLVKGIDKLEVTAPIIKEQPQEIYNQAKNKVMDVVQPHISKVCALRVAGQQKASSLKDLSWQKANEVLATQYGSIAITGVDTTTTLAERLLDYYFPKSETDIEDDNVPISAVEDPVLHTVQTVGRLSNKVARRVYRTVSRQIKELKKEDVQEYVASLIAVLRLTQYLNFINDKLHASELTAANATSDVSATESSITTTPTTTTTDNHVKAATVQDKK